VAEVATERRAATQEQRELDRLQTLIDEETKQFAPTEGVADVVPSPTIDGTVEPSAAMPVGGSETVAGGIETSLASGLATAEQLTGEPVTGAAVQPTALTPPLPTLEQAQAVLDTLENKEQLEIQGTPDGGFVVAQRAPVVEPTAVAPIAPTEMVAEAVPVETGGVTPEAVQPAVQVAPAEAMEAAPVPEAIEPVAAPEVTPEVARVVLALQEELSRAGLQQALGLKDEKHFRNAYLLPALDSGLVEMTRPETPRSSKQRYRRTALGLLWLELHRGTGKD
jgi:hypothetical protein